jgi:hypothetical protein
LSQLKKAGLKYWKNTPTFLKALATLVIALNAAWQLYSRFFFPEKPSVTVPPSAEVGQEKVTPQSPGKASKL